MQHHLKELRARRAAGESGFTLIELLVVVVIIGILIAIAIPVYLNYQKGAKDKSAASDVRNAVAALEQCNSDNSSYPSAITSAGVVTGCAGLTQIALSAGTTLNFALTAGPPQSYVLAGTNSGGTPKYYCYNSSKGGSVAAVSSASLTAATC